MLFEQKISMFINETMNTQSIVRQIVTYEAEAKSETTAIGR